MILSQTSAREPLSSCHSDNVNDKYNYVLIPPMITHKSDNLCPVKTLVYYPCLSRDNTKLGKENQSVYVPTNESAIYTEK